MNSNIIQRPIQSLVLHIRSKDALQLQNGFNTNFQVQLFSPLLIKNNQEVHINIMSAEIPYSFYNISSNLENNTLKYETGGVEKTLDFGNRNLDIDDLVEYANADADFSAIFTMSFDTLTNKITITNDTSGDVIILWTKSNINKELGYTTDKADETIATGNSSVSDFVVNLASVHSIFIKSNIGNGNVISTRAGNSTTLQKISVDVNSNGIIYLNSDDFRQITVSQSAVIDNIIFRITDQNDRLLQLNNCNYEFSMLFQIYNKNYLLENDNQNVRRNTNNELINTISQPTTLQNIQPEQITQQEDIDNTHPIQNTTEIEHKANRILLDQLLEQVENN